MFKSIHLLSLVLIIMLPKYLQHSRQYCLQYYSDKWGHNTASNKKHCRSFPPACYTKSSQACPWLRLTWPLSTATSALILQQCRKQYRQLCCRKLGSVWEPGLMLVNGHLILVCFLITSSRVWIIPCQKGPCHTICYLFNPLSPNIHKQILQTHLYAFFWRISWESLIKDHSIFSLVII